MDKLREEVFQMLGYACTEADDNCDGPLQVDHPYGRSWKPSKLASYNRWLRYRKEAEEGLVRLLCSHHNNSIRPVKKLAERLPEPF